MIAWGWRHGHPLPSGSSAAASLPGGVVDFRHDRGLVRCDMYVFGPTPAGVAFKAIPQRNG
jgi:hypothetical protein